MPTCVFKEIHPAFVVWPESETPRGNKSHTDNDLEIDANKLEWKMKSIKKANLRIPVAHVPNTRSSNVFHGNRNAVSRFQLGEMGFCFFLYIFTYSLINPLKKTKWSTIKLSFSDGSLTTKLKSRKKNEKNGKTYFWQHDSSKITNIALLQHFLQKKPQVLLRLPSLKDKFIHFNPKHFIFLPKNRDINYSTT